MLIAQMLTLGCFMELVGQGIIGNLSHVLSTNVGLSICSHVTGSSLSRWKIASTPGKTRCSMKCDAGFVPRSVERFLFLILRV